MWSSIKDMFHARVVYWPRSTMAATGDPFDLDGFFATFSFLGRFFLASLVSITSGICSSTPAGVTSGSRWGGDNPGPWGNSSNAWASWEVVEDGEMAGGSVSGSFFFFFFLDFSVATTAVCCKKRWYMIS